jgi:hypothetical protein
MPTPIESQANVSRLRRAVLTASAFAVLGGLLASGSVPCGFAELFHVPCPGCGSTRAVHALLRGDLAGVLHTNPFGPVLAALVLAFGVVSTLTVLRDGTVARVHDTRAGRFVTRALFVVAVLEIALWIARFFGALGGPVPV